MSFVSIILALVLERFAEPLEDWRRFEWYSRYQRLLSERLGSWRYWHGPVGVLVTVGLPLLALALVLVLLASFAAGILAALLGIAVLYYSLGPQNLTRQVRSYLALSGDEPERARGAAEALGAHAESGADGDRAVRDGILAGANDSLFGVLFWFLVLGPVGALLYRLAALSGSGQRADEPGFNGSAARLWGILAWLPARLLALTYALAGYFDGALAQWRAYREESRESFVDSIASVLIHTGRGALGVGDGDRGPDSDSVAAALDLHHRALGIWLIALALLTLSGWLI